MERRIHLLFDRDYVRTLVAAATTRECPENPPDTHFEAKTAIPVLPYYATGYGRTAARARLDLAAQIAHRARNPL